MTIPQVKVPVISKRRFPPITLADGRKIDVNWAYVGQRTTPRRPPGIANNFTEEPPKLFNLYMPVIPIEFQSPENLNAAFSQMITSDESENMKPATQDDLVDLNIDATTFGGLSRIGAVMGSAVAGGYITTQEMTERADMKALLAKFSQDLEQGKLAPDFVQKFYQVKNRLPTAQQLGTVKEEVANWTDRWNLETARGLAELPYGQSDEYLKRRQSELTLGLSHYDPGAAQTLLNSMPMSPEEKTQLQNSIRSITTKPMPSLVENINLGQVSQGLNLRFTQEATQAAINRESQMPQTPTILQESYNLTRGPEDEFERARKAELRREAERMVPQELAERQHKWRELVERARNAQLQQSRIVKI